jgi:glycosyltransferase involved in cell wall biosynthesis
MIKTLTSTDNVQVAAADVSLPHVLLVIDQFPESLGGGERVALKVAELLPRFGYRASILTFGIHPKSPALHYARCPIYVLPLQRVFDFNTIRAIFAFRSLLRSEQIQIVQTFFESSDLWGGLLTKVTSAAKLVWSRRDMGILRARKHRVAYRLMASMPDAVFAVSGQVRNHCIEVDHIDPERVFTIYNGLDLESWPRAHKYAKTLGGMHVTTVGNVRRVKGHDLFIQAAAEVLKHYPQVQFHVVGEVLEPEYFAELKQLTLNLGISSNFHFLGGMSDISDYLVGTDIFVLPSRSEGFSNAVIEAMAASLPVVATTVGGNAEAVVEGITGYLVDANDPVSLASAITKLVSDPAKAITMGAAGRALVVEKFTADAMMKSIAARYDALLSKSD